MRWWNSLTTTVRLLVMIAALAAIAGGIYVFRSDDNPSGSAPIGSQKTEAKYHCPMHPSVVSDKPGTCPICHMDLQPIDHEHSHEEMSPTADENKEGTKKERKILFYRHPMRSDITSPVPAKDEMGMDYIPVYEEEASATGEESSVEGRAGFRLSQERQQLIGVTYASAKKEKISRMIEATGRVAFDPELYTAIEEYRQALASRTAISESSFGTIKSQTDALVRSAKTRLKLLGLSENQIRKLGASNEDPISLILPKGKAWVYAEVFEYEAASLKQGLRLEAKSPSVPGEVFKGRISSVSQVISQPARTVRVQAEVDDPAGKLRPDTYLNVVIHIELGEKLSIPEDAVLFSQGKAYVFAAPERGRFEPRVIELGEKANGRYVVLSGLKEGEEVVRSANFLIDSEAKLRSVIEKANGGR